MICIGGVSLTVRAITIGRKSAQPIDLPQRRLRRLGDDPSIIKGG
jgi:hypothetical protein